jgi:SET domain-containing protein
MKRKLRSDTPKNIKCNTVVKRSPINGTGLFAARYFHEGELVEVIGGYIQGELERQSKSKYSIMVRQGKQTVVLTNKTKYISHSAQPNVKFNVKLDGVYALRDIVAGEELTSRYHSLFS